jgi:DnaJ-class molecular chaperone
LECHPDHGGDIDRFRLISDAYSLINSELNLKKFRSRKNSIFHWDKDLETYFGDLFGQKTAPARRTVYTSTNITLQEAFSGCKKQIFYKEVKTCRACGGLGGHSFDQQGLAKKTCDDCLGAGVKNQTHQTTVTIPQGITDGVEVPSDVDDVIVHVNVVPDERFSRKGFDVHSNLNITLRDIFKGSKVKVPTLHGDSEFEIPRCIQPEKVIRLKHKGFFDNRRNTYGDHILTIKLSIPEVSIQACEKIVECLDEIESKN